jgi:predicted transcriptional regulator
LSPKVRLRPRDAFLDSFSAIEELLRRATKTTRTRTAFHDVLQLAVKKDPSLGPVVDRLEVYSQLRNLIVHEGRDLAEPVKATLTAIAEIRLRLEEPPRLAPAFLGKTVSCRPSDQLRDVAKKMAIKDFSQLPVYSESGLLVGMVTTAAIARWLGEHADGVTAQLDTEVQQVMKFEEYPRAYRVFHTTDPVSKALAAFKQSTDLGQPLYAIVLTDDGRHNSAPRGVITLFDVPRLWATVFGS